MLHRTAFKIYLYIFGWVKLHDIDGQWNCWAKW